MDEHSNSNLDNQRGQDAKLSSIVYWMLRSIAWLLVHLVCRYRLSGREHVPSTGTLLIVANHLSWFDPILLSLVSSRRIWFFTKVEVFRWPVVGWLCSVTGQIPVHRGEGDRVALAHALAYLAAGRALVFFPEGTVERQEQMIAAHPGAAMIAMRSGATVLPIGHTGTRRVLRPGAHWFPHVRVSVGLPYKPTLQLGTARKVGLQLITQEMMQHIAEMVPAAQRGVYQK